MVEQLWCEGSALAPMGRGGSAPCDGQSLLGFRGAEPQKRGSEGRTLRPVLVSRSCPVPGAL